MKFEVIDNVFVYEPGNQRAKDQHFRLLTLPVQFVFSGLKADAL